MHDVLAALAGAAATPTPTPTQQVDPDLVTPGPWGFAIIVFITLAVILLIWDMLRRIRRGRVRADIDEELAAEEQSQRAVEATDVDDQSTDAADGDSPPRR
jgi:flagellar biosynthesis/type III secretory pathway M-ring protein FliF/YscJ